MFRIMLPIAAIAASRKLRSARASPGTANPAGTTNSAYTTGSPHTACSANAASTPNSSYATGSADISAVAVSAPRQAVIDAVSAIDVGISIEVIVVVDVDVVAAPAAAPAIAAGPERAHRHAYSKRDRDACRIVPGRRIVDGRIGIDGRTVDYDGTVGGHIDYLGIGRFDDDDLLALDDLGLDLLLFRCLQISLVLGLLAHALYGIHHAALLRQERISEVRCPRNVVGQALHHFGQRGQCLDAGIPGLLGDRVSECLVFQARVLGEPLLKLDDLERIAGCRENLRQEWIRIEGNWRDE
jgi:hypothetical protein